MFEHLAKFHLVRPVVGRHRGCNGQRSGCPACRGGRNLRIIPAPAASIARLCNREGAPMRGSAGSVKTLTRPLRPCGFAALLTAALAIGGIHGAAAESQIDALMAGRGKDVHFTVSCDPKLQPRFEAALAALHSFWYGQSLKEFTALAQANPDCAMAYWGVAMSLWNQLWAPPRPNNLAAGGTAIEKARGIASKSQREADYIDAL